MKARLDRLDTATLAGHATGDKGPSSGALAREHGISRGTALRALEMLAANKCTTRTSGSRPYRVSGTSPSP